MPTHRALICVFVALLGVGAGATASAGPGAASTPGSGSAASGVLADLVEAALVADPRGTAIDTATLDARHEDGALVGAGVLSGGHFTTATGLSDVGQRVLTELHTAPFHGLPVDGFVTPELLEALDALSAPATGASLRDVAGRAWLSAVARALPAAAGSADPAKVATAARMAAADDPAVAAWVAAVDAAHRDRSVARATVEAELTAALTRWAAALDPMATPSTDLASADPTTLDRALARLVPTDPDYAVLVRELARLRSVSNGGGWPRHPTDPVAASSLEGQAAVRARLAADGWFDGPSPIIDADRHGGAAPIDAALQDALARFQAHHELAPTGALDAPTLAALAVPASARAATVSTNLARLREARSRHDASRDAVLVNVAAFEVRLVLDGVEALRTRAVVGATTENGRNRTPLFSDQMERIELNPFWYVPPRIARRIHATPSRGYEWVGGQLVQRPGPHNSLGRAKFLFPNAHAVYLHDTNRPDLFEQTTRAASSGCVRVADPLELATHIIAWDTGRDVESVRAEVDAAIASGRTEVVPLARTLPVHIEYRTAWVAPTGRVAYASDVYGLDPVPGASPGVDPAG